MSLTDTTNAQGITLNRWGILIFAPKRVDFENALKGFIKTLVEEGAKKGVKIMDRNPPWAYEDFNRSPASLLAKLKETIMPAFNKIELLVVLTPSTKFHGYAAIKRFCDCEVGIASQCITTDNIMGKSFNKSFSANILMKLNSKLGGVNMSFDDSIMPGHLKNGTVYSLSKYVSSQVFMGADVTHPAPGAPTTRASLATMTGSIDRMATRYAAVAMNQEPRQEVIAGVEEMAYTLLGEYKKSCKMNPQRIIYMRDGVSEGQYEKIIENELEAIRRAAKSFREAGKDLTISVINVRKRHHTRLFPEHGKGNVEPGTVVDVDIVHPVEFDFCNPISRIS